MNLLISIISRLLDDKISLCFCYSFLAKEWKPWTVVKKIVFKNEKSIIALSSLAVLQWEFSRSSECEQTLAKLQDLYKLPEYDYLHAVAKSETGHAFLCYGPKFFLKVMDIYHDAIEECKNSNIYY